MCRFKSICYVSTTVWTIKQYNTKEIELHNNSKWTNTVNNETLPLQFAIIDTRNTGAAQELPYFIKQIVLSSYHFKYFSFT